MTSIKTYIVCTNEYNYMKHTLVRTLYVVVVAPSEGNPNRIGALGLRSDGDVEEDIVVELCAETVYAEDFARPGDRYARDSRG